MDIAGLSSTSIPEKTESFGGDNVQAGSAELLDNPIWNSLGSDHKGIAQTCGVAAARGLARRFPAYIGPLAGMPDQSDASYADLLALANMTGVGEKAPLVLFLNEKAHTPAEWKILREGLLTQMICEEPRLVEANLREGETLRSLTTGDAPAMVELARLTEPGPFALRTMELGRFFGIFQGDRLVAMAGQRLSLPGFVEVSAVCTHPDTRGRGFAPTLMSRVMEDIAAQGKVPFLHSWANNDPAIAVYCRLGFTFRRNFELAVLAL